MEMVVISREYKLTARYGMSTITGECFIARVAREVHRAGQEHPRVHDQGFSVDVDSAERERRVIRSTG
jgi:hypothetical protein